MTKNISTGLVLKLAVFHISIITLANYAVQFPLEFIGFGTTYGMFVFPLVILATDLTIRLSNKDNARVIVALAYIPAILISAWIADWRIGLASGTAYLAGQLLDIFIFQKVREKSESWWAAPLLSTFFANIIDTYIFFSVAFYKSDNEFMAANWLDIANVDLSFKIIVSILLFLPIYGMLLNFLTRKSAKNR
jgi:uncharacterized PurR-regulated membrane protein YhhQ (DUF165 family)